MLDRAIAAAPETPAVLLAKALWLVRQQRTDNALPLLARATELAPASTRYAYVYGVALHSSGQTEHALAVLDAVLRLRPEDQQLLEAAAGMARDAGDTARMQRYLTRIR